MTGLRVEWQGIRVLFSGGGGLFSFLQQTRGPSWVRTPEVKRQSIEAYVTSVYDRGLEYAELHLCFVIRLCVLMLN